MITILKWVGIAIASLLVLCSIVLLFAPEIARRLFRRIYLERDGVRFLCARRTLNVIGWFVPAPSAMTIGATTVLVDDQYLDALKEALVGRWEMLIRHELHHAKVQAAAAGRLWLFKYIASFITDGGPSNHYEHEARVASGELES